MSQSAEVKLRNLAAQNAGLVAALTWPNTAGVPTFLWMDERIAQGDLGNRSDGRCAVTVLRVSTQSVPYANQGTSNVPLETIRFQIDCISYNAEQARQAALLVKAFMNSISLCDPGEFASPQTAPNQAPNFLLNRRSGLKPQLNPPAFTQIQDWRVFNVDTVP